MRLLSRYIFKELVSVFALALLIFTLVLLLSRMLRLTDLVLNKGVPLSVVLKLLVYLSPSFLILIIPISLLVSAITVFSKLSTDSEIVAMKATGMSFLHMLGPVLVLSVAAYIATSYLIFVAFPTGNLAFQQVMFNLVRSKAALDIRPRVFNDTFSGLVLYAQEVPANDNVVRGVFIADRRQRDQSQTIVAQEGRLVLDPARRRVVLELRNGTIHKLLPGRERYQILHFRRHELALNLRGLLDTGQPKKGVKQMTADELRLLVDQAPPGSREGAIALVEYYKKFSLPVAALLLGFVGAPLGMVNRRSGRSGGFVISAAVVLFYYLLYTMGEGLGDEGRIPALWAMWMPNVVIALLAVYLVSKTAMERPFTYAEAAMRCLGIVGRAARRLVMGRIEAM
ncbi:MAG: LPS export ABC transporter permease LptF [Nitrospinae bacterium]|nr:LPS export ABC transporter permease LptF [Nitrospinota bacterium]